VIDPYTLVLAFILGLLAGRLFQSWRVNRWWWRLKSVMPRRCPVCGVWRATGDMQHAEHKTAGRALICQDCYDEQYHPFTKETP
jgi:hypothetical protein